MIKKDVFNQDVKARLEAASKDRIYRFIMADKKIKGAVVHATLMVNEMKANHALGPVETLILGQAYIAGALLCTTLKGDDRISLNIECSGPVKGLDVEANGYGEVRGFLKTPQIVASDPARVRFLSNLFGAGFLTVTRYLAGFDHPYSSRIHLVQTPQAFQYPLIKKAHDYARQHQVLGTDDASLVERIHADVKVIPGVRRNIKITTPEDLAWATGIISGAGRPI